MNSLRYARPGNGFIPLFSLSGKVEVNGPNETPLYSFLKESCPEAPDTNIGDPHDLFWTPLASTDIRWNFEKFIIDSHGKPRYRIDRSVGPTEIHGFLNEVIQAPGDTNYLDDLLNEVFGS
ncbi:unnamed protein product [Owenia fusiformis]|uniref:Glutathione peroxidase n=1 Tax=Owenia fusiformis TaxID=6347 RepID=A0A8S4PI07_OWEFU|nr:unnamed protein product [Owenia fusiformis]